jgi:hypothetical protein
LHAEKTAVEDSPDNGYDKNGKKINNNGGDTTDYLYDEKGKIIGSTSVKISTFQGGEVSSNMEGYGYRMRTIGSGGTLYDPSFDIMKNYVGGAVAGKALGVGLGYLSTSNKVGQLAFNSKYIGGSSKLFGRGYLGSFNGAKNGIFNRGTYRIGWSYYKGTHYFQPRIGPMFGAKHLTPWFQYKP